LTKNAGEGKFVLQFVSPFQFHPFIFITSYNRQNFIAMIYTVESSQ